MYTHCLSLTAKCYKLVTNGLKSNSFLFLYTQKIVSLITLTHVHWANLKKITNYIYISNTFNLEDSLTATSNFRKNWSWQRNRILLNSRNNHGLIDQSPSVIFQMKFLNGIGQVSYSKNTVTKDYQIGALFKNWSFVKQSPSVVGNVINSSWWEVLKCIWANNLKKVNSSICYTIHLK